MLSRSTFKGRTIPEEAGIAADIDEFSASARMNQYETGKHIPDLLTLKQISKILKVPIAYFTPKMIVWLTYLFAMKG